MEIEIIVIGAFALLTIGRIVWEKRSGRQTEATPNEDREWMNAIR